MILRRTETNSPRDLGLIFPNRNGGVMSAHNFRRGLRTALKNADLERFIPYLLRKTGATEVVEQLGSGAAAKLLGHTDTAVTKKHYVQRNPYAPDTSDVLGALLLEASRKPADPNEGTVIRSRAGEKWGIAHRIKKKKAETPAFA